jgi:hypothetical protein
MRAAVSCTSQQHYTTTVNYTDSVALPQVGIQEHACRTAQPEDVESRLAIASVFRVLSRIGLCAALCNMSLNAENKITIQLADGIPPHIALQQLSSPSLPRAGVSGTLAAQHEHENGQQGTALPHGTSFIMCACVHCHPRIASDLF